MDSLTTAIRLVIVDDQPWVRHGLQGLLRLEPDFEILATFENGESLLEWLRNNTADVVLMDVRMPGLGGIGTVQHLPRSIPVLLLTTFEQDEDMVAGLASGAMGYVLKDISLEQLSTAIRRVASGERYIQPRVAEVLAQALQRERQQTTMQLANLTTRETEVLRLMAQNLSNKRIAQALNLSEGTVKIHVSNVLSKFAVPDRLGAVQVARERGLL